MNYLEAIFTIIESNKELEAIGTLSRSALTKKNMNDISSSENLNRLFRIYQYNKENLQDNVIEELSGANALSSQ